MIWSKTATNPNKKAKIWQTYCMYVDLTVVAQDFSK